MPYASIYIFLYTIFFTCTNLPVKHFSALGLGKCMLNRLERDKWALNELILLQTVV